MQTLHSGECSNYDRECRPDPPRPCFGTPGADETGRDFPKETSRLIDGEWVQTDSEHHDVEVGQWWTITREAESDAGKRFEMRLSGTVTELDIERGITALLVDDVESLLEQCARDLEQMGFMVLHPPKTQRHDGEDR